ncbi:hypothetical protein OIU84_013458 [Salix udensis]|uniref:Uncharacterized protein n=1 Tax=Salix udensis TaxID=889485 RepID=A0AAD6JK33_9ROSI|nr:hypothetical protein OIU84_013458 [Salix udensis]
MEKSKSFPQYSSSFSGEFGFEDQSSSYNFNGPCQKGNGFSTSSDPELKRKKRIASYNVFTMEGKLKSSARNSFKWIKSKFSDVRYGIVMESSCLGSSIYACTPCIISEV